MKQGRLKGKKKAWTQADYNKLNAIHEQAYQKRIEASTITNKEFLDSWVKRLRKRYKAGLPMDNDLRLWIGARLGEK